MNVRDYEYIVKISEQQNISRAAASLYITQSALTRFLQRTEEELGLKLFIRKGHQFLPTDAGRQYIETGRIILHLDQDLTTRLMGQAARARQNIRFGSGMGRSDFLLDKVLPTFFKNHPDTKIALQLDTSRHLMMQLENQMLDLALVSNTEKRPAFHYIPVETSYMSVLVPQNSPLIKKSQEMDFYPFPVISLEQLKDQTFVLTNPQTHSGFHASEFLKRYLPEAKVSMEMSDTRSIMDAVERGFGISLMLSSPLGSRNLCYLSLRETKQIQSDINLVYRSDLSLSDSMQALIDQIRCSV